MREVFAIVFVFLIIALALCGVFANKSAKSIGKPVSYLVFSLMLPVIGNLIILISENELLSTIGYYIYFIGMNLMAFSLFDFTLSYCNIPFKKNKKCFIIYILLTIDLIQYLLNPFLGQAFGVEPVIVENAPYYRLIPFVGQAFHRVVIYSVLMISLIIFFVKSIRVPKIYSEKYYVLFFTILAAGIWQTFYIFSKTPVDRSMIGLGVAGVMIFYFSIIYRPLKLLDRMLANIATKISETLFFFDANDRCIWANGHGLRLLHLDSEKLERAPALLSALFDDFSRKDPEWTSEQIIRSTDGDHYYILEKRIVTDTKGHKIGSFFSIQDNTENEIKHQKELYNATHDKLTGLFTKDTLFKKIKQTVEKNPDAPYWIAYFDIKDFKIVNDIFGSEMGDNVLKRVADWLRSNSSEGWVYGRLGGDAFGIFFPSEAPRLNLIERQMSRFVISSGPIDHHVLMHVGLYRVTEPNIDVSIMFDRAHIALTSIKDEYNKHVAVYDDKMRDQVLWEQKISAQLDKALDEKQIRPYLQPIVDNKGTIIGAEALVRWIHPEDGFLPPIKFIPIFEKNGMIADIDKYIWRSACEILASWTGEKSNLFISVNISPKDFYFMDVFAVIKSLVSEYKIEPSRLRIEITETVMMTEAESRMAILSRFRDSGFIVEMDDFGSGYSSLNQLKDMPLDVLKIDMKFLSNTQNNQKAETILRNVLRLSSDLGLFSLTEGVETEDQYNMLNEMGCNLFQGYYFAKPMSVEDFEKLCSKS